MNPTIYTLLVLCIVTVCGLIVFFASILFSIIRDNWYYRPVKNYEYDDSEVRMFLARNHYKLGIYVRFTKEMRSHEDPEFIINKGEVIWLERLVNRDFSEFAIETYLPDPGDGYGEVKIGIHDCVFDMEIAKVTKNGHPYIIRLPKGFPDECLWETVKDNTESTF